MLTDRSLTWLRRVHDRGVDPDDDLGAIATWHALDSMAAHTPAWQEPYASIVERHGPELGWPELRDADCPQVVEVDFPRVALRRAEWIDGNLMLHLAVADPKPDARTSFRIVGAEPRLWDVAAPDRTFVDVRLSGIHVHMPMVDALVELVRGGY